MKRGISFRIPNEYGKYLADILVPFDCTQYNWKLECSTEIWKYKHGQLLNEDLFDNENDVNGEVFDELIKNNTYYVIFATLKAFPKGKSLSKFDTYENYTKSDCPLCLLIADCSYVEIYCKDPLLTEELYSNAQAKGYERIEYVTEKNDSRTRMSV